MSKEAVVCEIHKPARKNFVRRHVTVKGLNDLWQADLVEMQPYSKLNQGNKYILTVVDSFSKYAYAESIKQKTANHVATAFQNILKRSRGLPKNLQTDLGKEFFNKEFTLLMKKYNINHYTTYSKIKAAHAERFNRTLKQKMYLKFSLRGSYKWIDILQSLVHEYNTQKHRTIGMTPSQVNKSNEKTLLKTVYNTNKQIKVPKSILKKGDFVRISKEKGLFEKSYLPNWSTEIFKIREVQTTTPVTYLLEDSNGDPILGGFYQEEVKKTKYPNVYLVEKVLKRKSDRALVKWLGFKKPTWIDKSDIINT